jgi:hypothetical protein
LVGKLFGKLESWNGTKKNREKSNGKKVTEKEMDKNKK